MMNSVITPKIERFIRKNSKRISGTDIAEKFGINKGPVTRFISRHGLKPSRKTIIRFRSQKLIGRTSFTKAEDRRIRKEYLLKPVKALARDMDRSHTGVEGRLKAMGLKIPKRIREDRKRSGMFIPGQEPPNKGKKQKDYMTKEAIDRTKATRFKKGNIPKNTAEKDGTITLRTDHANRDGRQYYYIRVSLGEWYPLHQIIWQQKNGLVPKGYCLWFKDQDSLNVDIENLEMISRVENVRRNHDNFLGLPPELKELIILTNKLKNTIKEKLS